eukprot:CAMPEP_0175866448 /NCGR_PEP_ID=MMETSP0107_2-20121207/34224_1 /TAXON_ID=195067 ORGANISM="Goniomonas pacifica, Strain CCMP1869" /NCGR_SAMPLE_ID=MMETSP0107_2 /ASSEMBLY_ACC=CAM_ASM_000203 /LENGTH=605 /DNA_ID=CAMNT_0017183995 /DNA_START=24 /DNA_END=1841 /DNA_ORIENTATION=+
MSGAAVQPHRTVVINPDKCKPSKCGQECRRFCPPVQMGQQCVEVTRSSKVTKINSALCTGCGQCVRKCPFKALQMVKLPSELTGELAHCYGENAFRLYRLPQPRVGQVLGLLGANGTGKSTAMGILSGALKPNFGRPEHPPSWDEIIRRYRGSALQNYLRELVQGSLRIVSKSQHVAGLRRSHGATLAIDWIRDAEHFHSLPADDPLEVGPLLDRRLQDLSGGELQRVAITRMASQHADVYLLDEPSCFLDLRHRIAAAKTIRQLARDRSYVIVVDHDLIMLELVANSISILYGQPLAYGVVANASKARHSINSFLRGYIKHDNLRFRDTELTFRAAADDDDLLPDTCHRHSLVVPPMAKSLGPFQLTVQGGTIQQGHVTLVMGPNGCGKTTLLRLVSGKLRPDHGGEIPERLVSYKPQEFKTTTQRTVGDLLGSSLGALWMSGNPRFLADVARPLGVDKLVDQAWSTLSGGEMQRVALVLCLGKTADIYVIDEPSANLDAEQRLAAAAAIRRWTVHNNLTTVVVEHDLVMAAHMGARVVRHVGVPGVEATVLPPVDLAAGIAAVVEALGLTFRRDKETRRPRVNRPGSSRDLDQRASGIFFAVD